MHTFDNGWEQLEFSTYLFAWKNNNNNNNNEKGKKNPEEYWEGGLTTDLAW